jgi:hypothetical protein
MGSLHSRDFAEMRQQVPLSEVPVDAGGYVRFSCTICPRTGRIALADLQARFRPREGLVNILNAVAPKDCPKVAPDPWGNHPCGFCYRDLGGPING